MSARLGSRGVVLSALMCTLAAANVTTSRLSRDVTSLVAGDVTLHGRQESTRPDTVRVASGSITATCRLTLGGSFEAVSESLEGELSMKPDATGMPSGSLQVALDTFDTGIGLRNTHMRENYLETGRGPDFARATLTRITLAKPDVAVSGGRTTFEAQLMLHGVPQKVRGVVRVDRTGDGLRIDATFPVSLAAHGVPEPRYLGIGVRDEIDVRVAATFMPAGGAR